MTRAMAPAATHSSREAGPISRAPMAVAMYMSAPMMEPMTRLVRSKVVSFPRPLPMVVALYRKRASVPIACMVHRPLSGMSMTMSSAPSSERMAAPPLMRTWSFRPTSRPSTRAEPSVR